MRYMACFKCVVSPSYIKSHPVLNLRVYSKPALSLIMININTLIIKDKLINNAGFIIFG